MLRLDLQGVEHVQCTLLPRFGDPALFGDGQLLRALVPHTVHADGRVPLEAQGGLLSQPQDPVNFLAAQLVERLNSSLLPAVLLSPTSLAGVVLVAPMVSRALLHQTPSCSSFP